MPRLLTAILTFVCVVSTLNVCLAENKPAKPDQPSVELGTPLFEDTFERDELGGRWSAIKGDWKIVDGALEGREKEEDEHAAVVSLDQPVEPGVLLQPDDTLLLLELYEHEP